MSTRAQGKLAKQAWIEIRKHYHAGLLSVREIARQFGITEAAIRKAARKYGWERDLLPRVRQELRRRLVQDDDLARPLSDVDEQQIINEKAGEGYAVIQLHRRDCWLGRQMFGRLLADLGTLSEVSEQEAVAASGGNRGRAAAILKAASLPVRAAVLRDLSVVLSRIIPLERQAWNLSENETDESYEEKLRRLMIERT